jgi:hypothetical protein
LTRSKFSDAARNDSGPGTGWRGGSLGDVGDRAAGSVPMPDDAMDCCNLIYEQGVNVTIFSCHKMTLLSQLSLTKTFKNYHIDQSLSRDLRAY